MNKFLNKNIFYKFMSRRFSLETPQKLKKKFYKEVSIVELPNNEFKEEMPLDDYNKKLYDISKVRQYYYYVLLDGRKCKTLYSDELKIPNKKLALSIAQEFQRQKEDINLYSMHLVKLYNKELLCFYFY
jgi:hypothetical protein